MHWKKEFGSLAWSFRKKEFGSNNRSQCFRQKSPWPLSLLAFRAASHTLALPRRAVSSADPLLDYLDQHIQTDNKPAQSKNTKNNVKYCCRENASSFEGIYNSHDDVNTAAPCCQSDDNHGKEPSNVSPVEQVSASWGDSDSELSAGNTSFLSRLMWNMNAMVQV